MIYEPTAHTPRRPSPAVLFVGRQNSGKTTLLEKVISCLTQRGLKIATLKHHGHPNFEIDIPGKDSWRHRQAGALSTFVLSAGRMALTRDLEEEMSCFDALQLMTGYDLVLVEGFRGVGLPALELFREGNPKDEAAAQAMLAKLRAEAEANTHSGKRPSAAKASMTDEATRQTTPTANANAASTPAEQDKLDQAQPASRNGQNPDSPELPVALITNMEHLANAATSAGIPVFGFEDIEPICDFVLNRYARAPLTIAVQAGGESKRMGHSKARTPFLGRPLIEHMLDVVSNFADELIVTTNEAEKLRYLKEMYPGLRLAADIMPERGALPGLLTAINASSNELVGVVACDMIAFPTKLLAREALALQATGADAVLPFNVGYWEPFAGVYRKSTCEPALRGLVESGSKRMHDLIDAIDCRAFSAKGWQRPGMIDPFANTNTPEELAQAEVLYRVYK